MLLGVNIYTEILMSGVLRGEPGSPIAQQTQLGWIISGGASKQNNPHGIVTMHLSVALDTMLQKFWEDESLPSEEHYTLTDLETRAEKIYEKTVERDTDGRYVVALPFMSEKPTLPENSRQIAAQRLSHLERKLSKNENLRQEYNEVMREYITLRHMEPVGENEKYEAATYLPHHAVIRNDKHTTRWSSNSTHFMTEIEPEKRAKKTEIDLNKKETIKTLGIIWNVREDDLQVTNKIETYTDKECRVKPSRPFSISGVDFAGPINARMSKGRGAKSFKAYIALFICMVTKAIHIELVSDMTTDAFMAAFKRFISRRGPCREMWSDNGTTFVSASKEILNIWKEGKSSIPDELSSLLDSEGTKWKFIPPGAPNFGGLWEAGVKSTKFHLKRIIGESTLTFEELNTLLTQIEACLNSRPLSPISDHPDDLDPLTPAHFLVGESLIILPESDYTDLKEHSLTRWQLTQRMMQSFWKKWQSEYMSRLQQRPKWRSRQKEFNIGDLVLIKDPRCLPSKWLLGRVMTKHTGQDNLTRAYDIRTSTGVVTRAISKLCPLPNV
ncbi:uncharacterized protein LOC126381137 [Pectinophora gossypiella]|uniref:uncharacterized protein LOC126381137 n=1 Tax=Pectinophora gossypiella TaxID=13191 RepID=UPI00214E25B3|nr:uncharacterized protein LOC126381137 [Pectinophora gossypiella]